MKFEYTITQVNKCSQTIEVHSNIEERYLKLTNLDNDVTFKLYFVDTSCIDDLIEQLNQLKNCLLGKV